jgi:taurine--2-oxoglutarate transaminase
MAGGLASTIFQTSDGKHYLDFSNQLVNMNIGHQAPKVIDAVKAQADRLTMVAGAANLAGWPERPSVSSRKAGRPFNEIFFTNGGADANENAMRMARLTYRSGQNPLPVPTRSYQQHRRGRRRSHRRLAPRAQMGSPVDTCTSSAVPLPLPEFWACSPEQKCARACCHLNA